MRSFVSILCVGSLLAPPVRLLAEEPVDLATVTRIRDEGLNRSKVQEPLQVLCDEIGGRVTGSSAMKKASGWALRHFLDLGLKAWTESYPFGKGWTLESLSLQMVSPDTGPIPAVAKAWSKGTDGPRRAKVVRARLETDEDLVAWKGKLEGKIVLLSDEYKPEPPKTPDSRRYSESDLDEQALYRIGGGRGGGDRAEARKRRLFSTKKLPEFLAAEKVVATLEASKRTDGTIRVQAAGTWKKDGLYPCPSLVVAAEAYGRLVRLAAKSADLELEIDVRSIVEDEDPAASANVFAEIPGAARKDEIVMLGAHLDSWHAGTGATDNGAGSAVVLEAMRILKTLGLKPTRTIRAALWSGEEQGLLGSHAYADAHLGARPEPMDPVEREQPAFLRRSTGPLTLKAEHGKVSAYFNVDNGSGKIRGIYAQENAEAVPIFEAWLKPLHDLGATLVTMNRTGSTDHVSFDAVGVPGFQFVQDPLDYSSRTHHTSLDVLDRARRQDLMQAATVLATFVWQAANRPQMLPRKPLPPESPAEPTPAE